MIFTNISTASKLEVFKIMEACTHLKTESDFENSLKQMRTLFGHEMAACGVGDARSKKVISTINSGFPDEFMSSIIDRKGQIVSPLFQRWISNQAPQVLDFAKKSVVPAGNRVSIYQKFSLRNIMSHGVMDYNKRYMTYFGFAQMSGEINENHVRLLEILAPHLHVAYVRIASTKQSSLTTDPTTPNTRIDNKYDVNENTGTLTKREREVLRWLLEGKSNWDIGNILSISEFTVKNHVQRILKRLGANSRQHAVAKAIDMGIIHL